MMAKITPMDHGLPGKVGDKPANVGESRKVGKDPGSVPADATRSSAAGDTVELTSRAKLLEQLEQRLSEVPEIDRAKVEAVRAAIENGDFVIDAEGIADALLRSEQELGKPKTTS